jgi:hypothetical protein
MDNVLNSEQGLTMVATVLGTFWAFVQSSKLFTQMRTRKYYRAVEALEAAVEQTYRTYVRAIKDAREDGKLTDDEQRNARALARQSAVEFGERQGVDVLKELGSEYLDLWIARLVKKLKAE